MIVMTQKKNKATQPKGKTTQRRSPAWVVNLRLDESLEPLVESYINSSRREFTPTYIQVFEKALKMLLRQDGILPPLAEDNPPA